MLQTQMPLLIWEKKSWMKWWEPRENILTIHKSIRHVTQKQYKIQNDNDRWLLIVDDVECTLIGKQFNEVIGLMNNILVKRY